MYAKLDFALSAVIFNKYIAIKHSSVNKVSSKVDAQRAPLCKLGFIIIIIIIIMNLFIDGRIAQLS